VARHCVSCAASFPGRAHAHECHAYERLKRNERGLTLEHDDLRLLLRVLSRRRQSIDDESSYGVRVVTRDDDTQEENRSCPQESDDPFLVAAAKDSDVIVDTFDDLDALMSGAGDDDDDGRLNDVALATIREVAKQCKFLVAAACRSSEETYARLLGKLQLNGFEITAAEAEAEAGASGREDGDEEKTSSGKKQRETVLREPVGLGVFPSASRFNHSCEPNCAQRFDAFACVVVETTRHVRQGEELTIPYVDVALNLEKRNERLERAFAFRCDCARCARERRA
jgi:SET and MYND domain-containing protein